MTKAKRPVADASTPIGRLAASFAASNIPRSGEPDDGMVCIETGHLIRRMRKKRGLTQGDLARRVGTSQSHISDLERGAGTQGPTVTLLVRIARACGETLLIVPDSEVVELRQFRALEGRGVIKRAARSADPLGYPALLGVKRKRKV